MPPSATNVGLRLPTLACALASILVGVMGLWNLYGNYLAKLLAENPDSPFPVNETLYALTIPLGLAYVMLVVGGFLMLAQITNNYERIGRPFRLSIAGGLLGVLPAFVLWGPGDVFWPLCAGLAAALSGVVWLSQSARYRAAWDEREQPATLPVPKDSAAPGDTPP